MKIAVVVLLLSLAALGLAGFATARSLNESHPAPLPPAVESQWSEAECEYARAQLDGRSGLLGRACLMDHSCDAYNDMVQAIADNCSDPIPWAEAECEQARRELEQIARTGPACAGSSTPRCKQYSGLFQAIVDNCP